MGIMTPRQNSVLEATLLCNRKASSQLIALPHIMAMEGVNAVYVNLETETTSLFAPLAQFLQDGVQKPVLVETWFRSRWPGGLPAYDQDNKRLLCIIHARNMAIDFALTNRFEWLLFVDADVCPKPDGLAHLLALNQPLCGGLVPGRGVHGHVSYVFPGQIGVQRVSAGVIRCGSGTGGYMLIHWRIFSRLRFRWGLAGPLHQPWEASEDVAYCDDAIRYRLTDAFYIATAAGAAHWDDPATPLTADGVGREISEIHVDGVQANPAFPFRLLNAGKPNGEKAENDHLQEGGIDRDPKLTDRNGANKVLS